jgi:hypothetical protein
MVFIPLTTDPHDPPMDNLLKIALLTVDKVRRKEIP